VFVQPLKLSRSDGLAFSRQLHLALKEWDKENWTVRVLISGDKRSSSSVPVVWLVIDKCRVAEFLGQYFAEKCDSINSFLEMYWSTEDEG
jgi:hypothetical protein